MLVLLSPAKKLAAQKSNYQFKVAEPLFKTQIKPLIETLKSYEPAGLSKLMGLSDSLANLNYQRYQDFDSNTYNAHNANPAILNFQGDVYRALDVETLDATALDFAQETLCILSGLYGILRPFDLMQNYRLEMGTSLAVGDHQNLYQYWMPWISDYLKNYCASNTGQSIINLASLEYSKVCDFKSLGDRVIHIVFKEKKEGALKTIGILAKKARGLMARYIVQNQISSKEHLKDFNLGGYHFDEDLSDEKSWVFVAMR